MWKKFLIHALTGAVLSGMASVIYNLIYKKSFYVNFSSVINTTSIIGACTFACMLIAIGHFIVFKWKGAKLIGLYNIVVLVLSFASIIGVLSFLLPLDVEFPEMFIGLAIPMHFFPALAYFAVEPFFKDRS